MVRRILLSLFSIISISAFAQREVSDTTRREHKINQYFGIQANQLFKQILNLNNTNSTIDNPFLLNYSLNSAKHGWGLNVGFGMNIANNTTGDKTLKRKTEITSSSIRIGFEKKSMISKRWMVSWGIDYVSKSQKNTTTADSDLGNDNKSTVKTASKVKSSGYGPRVTINYKISDKVLIGTEATYYYLKGNNKVTINSSFTTSTQVNQQGETELKTVDEEDTTTNDVVNFDLTVPVALFLIVKF